MKKWLYIIMICICSLVICGLLNLKYVENLKAWDCTVTCAKEDDSNKVIYSNEKIISSTGVLTFQNRNDFDIVIYLSAEGQEERIDEIKAHGIVTLYQITNGIEYTVGCNADVAEETEMKLMVYDGERSEPYFD